MEEGGITTILFEKGCLVNLFIGRPTGIKKLNANDMLLEGIDDKAILLGHKKLLPKDAMNPFIQIEQQARAALAKKSLSFPVGKANFTLFKTLPSLKKSLDYHKGKWEEALNILIDSYTDLRTVQIQRLNDQAKTIAYHKLQQYTEKPNYDKKKRELETWIENQIQQNQDLFPSVSTLRQKFTFQYQLFKVSLVEGFEQMTDIEQEEFIKAKDQIESNIQKWTNETIIAIHKSLGMAAVNAKTLLEKQGKLNPKNLKPLIEAFETFSSLDFTETSTFKNTIEDIKSKYFIMDNDDSIDYQKSAVTIAYESSKEELSQLLSTIGTLAVDQVAQTAGIQALSVGEFRRFIEI